MSFDHFQHRCHGRNRQTGSFSESFSQWQPNDKNRELQKQTTFGATGQRRYQRGHRANLRLWRSSQRSANPSSLVGFLVH